MPQQSCPKERCHRLIEDGYETLEWDGATLTSEGLTTFADGSTVKDRCIWLLANDYMTSEGTCEQFTGGK